GDLCTSTCPMNNPRGHYLRAGSGPRNLRLPRIEPTPGFEPGTFRLQGGCTNRLCYMGKTLTSVPVHHRRSAFSSWVTAAVVSRHPGNHAHPREGEEECTNALASGQAASTGLEGP